MQKDLFGTAAAAAATTDGMTAKISFLDRYRMSIRLDQALFLLIGLLVIYVLVFSFGVETGKRYAMEELKAERLKRERVTEELRDKIFANNQIQTAAAAAPAKAAGPQITAPDAKEAKTAVAAEIAAGVQQPKNETAAEVVSASTVNGKFTIQIATTANKAAAEWQLKRLAQKGIKGFIIPRGKKSEICVDNFESREKASQILKQMKTRGLIPTDAYVRAIAA